MQAKDIEWHLVQLGQELADRGVQKPIRVLMIGGAYMLLLAKVQRSTDDVDILWLDEEDAFQRAIEALWPTPYLRAVQNVYSCPQNSGRETERYRR